MKLSIAHITNRKDSKVEWFLDSLDNQLKEFPELEVQVIRVDFHAKEGVRHYHRENRYGRLVHVFISPPKPSVWQGPHRLTKEDYFAASNARNTAICLAEGEWLACVDDLSVLMPGWLAAVKRAIDGNYIALGAYKKVKNLVVENGIAVSYDEFPEGVDTRWPSGRDTEAVVAAGSWLYGCSFAAPIEALLKINGSDEDSDSMGSEDYLMGIMLEKAGYGFRYDRRMLTLESEELHGVEKPFKRIIKKHPDHKDASHAILNWVMSGNRNTAPNYFGEGGIRALRDRVLAGEPFPIPQIPAHHWPDGQPLTEM